MSDFLISSISSIQNLTRIDRDDDRRSRESERTSSRSEEVNDVNNASQATAFASQVDGGLSSLSATFQNLQSSNPISLQVESDSDAVQAQSSLQTYSLLGGGDDLNANGVNIAELSSAVAAQGSVTTSNEAQSSLQSLASTLNNIGTVLTPGGRNDNPFGTNPSDPGAANLRSAESNVRDINVSGESERLARALVQQQSGIGSPTSRSPSIEQLNQIAQANNSAEQGSSIEGVDLPDSLLQAQQTRASNTDIASAIFETNASAQRDLIAAVENVRR